MFDPAAWLILPDGSAVPRDTIKPCLCGNVEWEIRSHVYRNKKEGTSHRADILVCPKCVQATWDDRVLRRVDVRREKTA